MSLTWKDGVTTILALLVAGLYYAKTTGSFDLPYIGTGYRMAVLVLFVVGIAMCAFSGGNTAGISSTIMNISATLGVFAVIFTVYGLISGAQLAFMLLTGTILLLWIISTIRHFISG